MVNGEDPATRSFQCEIKGEGTLPSLTLQDPITFDATGKVWLKFARTPKGRRVTQTIVVKNNGVVAVSALIAVKDACGGVFELVEGEQMLKVAPKKSASFTIAFVPRDVQQYEGCLKLFVDSNPFEKYQIALVGEGFQDEVMFEGLPHGKLDELIMGDTRVDVPINVEFVLRNSTNDRSFRVKWVDHPSVKFTPAAAHIHPGGARTVTATYLSKKVEKLGGGPAPVDPKTGKPLPDPGTAIMQVGESSFVVDFDSVLMLMLDE